MAVLPYVLSYVAYLAVSNLIDQFGGDPEGDVADEAIKHKSLSGLQQQMPMNRARQRLSMAEESQGFLKRELSDINSEMGEVNLGRRVTTGRDLLQSVSDQLGTTPEDLGRRLSPTNVGDYSSVSQVAFGRSPKRMKQ